MTHTLLKRVQISAWELRRQRLDTCRWYWFHVASESQSIADKNKFIVDKFQSKYFRRGRTCTVKLALFVFLLNLFCRNYSAVFGLGSDVDAATHCSDERLVDTLADVRGLCAVSGRLVTKASTDCPVSMGIILPGFTV